jgi:squalene-associated FAD-dependent desaturase
VSAPSVVVVGGGLAGLASALACADAGARVTLLEARPRLGGRTSSFRRGGLTVDTGQHVFLRCFSAYRWFLGRIGTAELAPIQPRLAIPVLSPDGTTCRFRRSGLPAPAHLLGALARYRHLRLRDRVAAARAAAALRRLHPREADDETFGAWLAAQGQSREAVERLWDLFARPALNLPAAEASLSLAAFVFRRALLLRRDAGDLGIPLVPLGTLHGEAAAAALARAGADVRTRVRATAIDVAGDRPKVHAEGLVLEADAVILAVPHDAAARLLPPAAGLDPARLRALGSSPIVDVHLVFDRRVADVPFAAAVGSPVQWVFDRTLPAGLAEGQYLVVSVSAAAEEVDEPAEVIRRRHLGALAALFPRVRGARVVDAFVTRERLATFRQTPAAARLRPGTGTAVPGLFLAGSWTDTGWPDTMEGAVRSGLAAARAALRTVGRARGLPAEVAA